MPPPLWRECVESPEENLAYLRQLRQLVEDRAARADGQVKHLKAEPQEARADGASPTHGAAKVRDSAQPTSRLEDFQASNACRKNTSETEGTF